MSKSPYFNKAPIVKPMMVASGIDQYSFQQAYPDANAVKAKINSLSAVDLARYSKEYLIKYAAKLSTAFTTDNALSSAIAALSEQNKIAAASINNLKSKTPSLAAGMQTTENKIKSYINDLNQSIGYKNAQLSYVGEIVAIAKDTTDFANAATLAVAALPEAKARVFDLYLFGFDVSNYLDAYQGLVDRINTDIAKSLDLITNLLKDEKTILGVDSYLGREQAAVDKANLEYAAKEKERADQKQIMADLYNAADKSIIPVFLKKVLWNLAAAGTKFNPTQSDRPVKADMLAVMQASRDNLLWKILTVYYSTPDSVKDSDAEIISVFGDDTFTKDDVLNSVHKKIDPKFFAETKPPVVSITSIIKPSVAANNNLSNIAVLKVNLEEKKSATEDPAKKDELEKHPVVDVPDKTADLAPEPNVNIPDGSGYNPAQDLADAKSQAQEAALKKAESEKTMLMLAGAALVAILVIKGISK